MLLLYFLLFFSINNWFFVFAPFGFPRQFYQVVNIDISHEESEVYVDDTPKLPSYINMSFSAFGQNVKVTAHKTVYPKVAVKIVGAENNTIWEPLFYERSQNSSIGNMTIIGVYDLLSNIFMGFVTEDRSTYYIEPAKYHSRRFRNNNKAYLVNKAEDYLEFVLHPDRHEDKVSATCFIELIADYTLYEAMNEDINFIASRLYLHVRYTSLVLQNTNFLDKVLHLSPKTITIYSAEKYPFYSNYSTPYEYADNFKYFPNDACLVGALTNLPFKEVSGLAGRQSACKSNETDKSYLGNKFVLTFRDYPLGDDFYAFPLSSTLTLFAHEVGHTFGAMHNERTDPECYKAPNGLHYMLSGLREYVEFHIPQYSPCNIQNMRNYIQSNGQCLEIATINTAVSEVK